MTNCNCVAKHRLEAAGYIVYKPSCFPERSIKRIVTKTGRDNPWLVNSHEEMSELADKLLGPCGCGVIDNKLAEERKALIKRLTPQQTICGWVLPELQYSDLMKLYPVCSACGGNGYRYTDSHGIEVTPSDKSATKRSTCVPCQGLKLEGGHESQFFRDFNYKGAIGFDYSTWSWIYE